MPKITKVRPVLLSAAYADPGDIEHKRRLPSGHRNCGLVEVTLDDGTTGVGEGYAAVFAPHVFRTIVELLAPYVVGLEALDRAHCYETMCSVTNYWSWTGAARHAISACEIAILDAAAKHLRVPAYQLLGGKRRDSIELYGSGGDSATPAAMHKELELLQKLGIRQYKIRARNHQVAKTVWSLNNAGELGIAVGVDMIQNLDNPGQTVAEAAAFVEAVHARTEHRIEFLEEALGFGDLRSYPLLRAKVNTKVCGGECATSALELSRALEIGAYDFVQPDATVMGGAGQVMDVFATARQYGMSVVVHCWGGSVCMMANYHAAFAGGSTLAEWPIKPYALRDPMMVEPLRIVGGRISAPTLPGLGVRLTPDIEREFPFREDAAYHCCIPKSSPPLDDVWE